MKRLVLILCFVPLLSWANPQSSFEKLFTDWTVAFNHKDLPKTCALFSPRVVADYRGVPQKNYDVICNGFKKVFADAKHKYQYDFKIHQVYQEGDLAAVRITWYLKIINDKNDVITSQDEGLDVLRKDENGQWKIVNYLGYEV